MTNRTLVAYILGYLCAGFVSFGTASAAPPMLRAKECPKDYDLSDLNVLLPEGKGRGALVVLVWEVVDLDKELAQMERCLILKRYDKPTKDGETCALGYFERCPKIKNPKWCHPTVIITTPGKPTTFVEGGQTFKSLPTDEEIAAFLKLRKWEVDVNPGEKKRSGRVKAGDENKPPTVKYTPKLTDGGVCVEAWKKAFDREPSSKLFPELATPVEKK